MSDNTTIKMLFGVAVFASIAALIAMTEVRRLENKDRHNSVWSVDCRAIRNETTMGLEMRINGLSFSGDYTTGTELKQSIAEVGRE